MDTDKNADIGSRLKEIEKEYTATDAKKKLQSKEAITSICDRAKKIICKEDSVSEEEKQELISLQQYLKDARIPSGKLDHFISLLEGGIIDPKQKIEIRYIAGPLIKTAEITKQDKAGFLSENPIVAKNYVQTIPNPLPTTAKTKKDAAEELRNLLMRKFSKLFPAHLISFIELIDKAPEETKELMLDNFAMAKDLIKEDAIDSVSKEKLLKLSQYLKGKKINTKNLDILLKNINEASGVVSEDIERQSTPKELYEHSDKLYEHSDKYMTTYSPPNFMRLAAIGELDSETIKKGLVIASIQQLSNQGKRPPQQEH